MATTILSASGLLFWGIVLLIIGLNARLLTVGNEAGAVLLTAAALVATVLFTDAEFNLFWMAVLVPVYFLIGTGWAIYKWNAFLDKDIASQKESYALYAESEKKANKLPKPLSAWFTRQTAKNNAEAITGWIALWPFSMSYVVLQFPWRLAQAIWRKVSTTFERIAARKYDVNGA